MYKNTLNYFTFISPKYGLNNFIILRNCIKNELKNNKIMKPTIFKTFIKNPLHTLNISNLLLYVPKPFWQSYFLNLSEIP